MRRETLEVVGSRINSEVKYLEAECLPEHEAALAEILTGLTNCLGESTPRRKKAFMSRVSRLMGAVRTKRRNDDTQVSLLKRPFAGVRFHHDAPVHYYDISGLNEI